MYIRGVWWHILPQSVMETSPAMPQYIYIYMFAIFGNNNFGVILWHLRSAELIIHCTETLAFQINIITNPAPKWSWAINWPIRLQESVHDAYLGQLWWRTDRQFLAATKQLYEWFSPSVRPCVRPSVCPSVRHTFLTMFPSFYHHDIFRRYNQWQKWRPCKRSRLEVKGQSHRAQHPT